MYILIKKYFNQSTFIQKNGFYTDIHRLIRIKRAKNIIRAYKCNLDPETIRDCYPLPITKHVLERVIEKEAYSFLDGFLGYNQVPLHPNDQHKIAFATNFGKYTYRVMPFELTNAPPTF